MKCKPWIGHFQHRKFQRFSSQFALHALRALDFLVLASKASVFLLAYTKQALNHQRDFRGKSTALSWNPSFLRFADTWSPENVSCCRASPRLHQCKSGVALEQETFSGLPGHLPERLLANSGVVPGDQGRNSRLWHFSILGSSGLSSSFPRAVPYSSSRKGFCHKVSRSGK